MAVKPSAIVPGPSRAPLPFGLFSSLVFRPNSGDRWQVGVTFETLGEPTDSVELPEVCDPPDTVDLSGVGPGRDEGSPIRVRATYECSPVGRTLEEANQYAVDRLEAWEEIWVENALASGDNNQSPNFKDDAEQIAGTETLSLTEALAWLEATAALSYGSQPMIHVSKATAILMLKQGLLESRGQRLYTKLHTPVVAGAGYTFETLVATPPAVAYRGEIETSDDALGVTNNISEGTIITYAERPYLIAFEDHPILEIEFTDSIDFTTP